ncbi:MAG: DUF2948 domain-containing protein [Hyphomicrobiales bacterium]|nr:MAG: DUF2948 domain-containing protein [Hyphomicrobiales bacterium]
MEPVKLVALDTDDLDVLSAFTQDAVLKVGDIAWLQGERRLVVTMNRFVWEKAGGKRKRGFERRLAALHFDQVGRVQASGIPQGDADQVLSLLTIRFEESADEAPAGTITLTFAGGGSMRLAVDCLEAQLADLGAAWTTKARPSHGEDA